MAGLSISLLGPFQATLDGQTITGFESNKVRALLVYLAVEVERPHAREALAGLLWPGYTHRSALNNLRNALANLRKATGDRQAQPPFLLISRNTLQFNAAGDCTLDIAGLNNLAGRPIAHLEQVVEAQRGIFLEGFSLEDSPPFEEWLLYRREQTNRQLLEAMLRLAAHYETCGNYQRAIDYARRALALEPWHEPAQRQLLRALYFDGQRSSALAQHEAFSRLLMRELSVTPTQETAELVARIREGTQAPVVKISEGDLAIAPPAPGDPPFMGLNFFDEADADLFFGREKLTAQLVDLVAGCLPGRGADRRVVTVIGASGSGKSSVVRAGLVPALKGQEIPFTGPICVFTPTAHPLEALAVSLTSTADSVLETTALIDDLARDPRSLHLAAVRLAQPENGAQVLLVVDQFEELFTQCRDEADRKAFIDNLINAAEADGPTTVVVVLRADFYAQCAPYEVLRRALCARQQYIGAMSAQEIQRAITEPARGGSWAFEPGLVDLLLRDVSEEPGALPLLSHALLETWRRRDGRMLSLAAYQESGGVQGAIAQTAETVYQQLTPEQQAIARAIFLRLVELGDDGDDETLPALYTRRRADLGELVARPEEDSEVQAVLNTLADARLITVAQETAEVAHEALIGEWARLRGWLEENREALRLQRRLTTAAQEWERIDRDSSALYRGARLAQAAEWAAANRGELSMQEQSFIEASLAEEQAQQAAEEAQRRRELEAARALAETETQRAEEQAESAGRLRKRAVWLVLALGSVVVLLLVAAGLGLVASRNAREAQEQTRLATSRELAAAAVNNLQVDPERSVLLALQALETVDTLEARNALHQALPELHILRTIPAHGRTGAPGVAINADGSRLASIGVDSTVKVWEAASGDLLLTLPGDAKEIGFDVAYSPDGKLLAAVWATQVMFWDAASGERLFALPGETAGTARRLAFSPDGKQLAVANMDGPPRVWDFARQEEVFSLTGHDQICEAVAYSPDGKRLATGDMGGVIKIWDAEDGQELLSFEHGGMVHSVAYSPDGTQLAVASDNGRLGIWDTASGDPLLSLPVQSGIYDVDYLADGKRLAATHQDGTTTIWDPLSGQQLLNLAGHVSTVVSAAASPDNESIVTGGYDGTVKLWDINPGRELLTMKAHDEMAYDLTYSPDGSRLATAGFEGKVKLWDPATGLLAQSLPPDDAEAGLSSLALSPDGGWMALGGWDGMLYVTNMDSGQIELALPGHKAPILDLAFSPDGQLLATAGWDGVAKVWDLGIGEAAVSFSGHGANTLVSSAAFTPDGQHVFTGGDDGYVREWDAATGEELRRFSGDGLEVYGLALSPDGEKLAMGLQDGAILLFDTTSGEELHQLSGHNGLVLRLGFSADGSKLVSAAFDSFAKVWDVQSGQELMTLYGNIGNVFGVVISPDGKQLATAGGDGTVRLYTLEMDELVALARERVTRELTDEECQNYLHTEQCSN